MNNGPGKYDDACTQARLSTQARACLLLIGDGKKGNGFSLQTVDPIYIQSLPAALRAMADAIELQALADAIEWEDQ
jgi:hypothetical protein